MKNYTIVVLLIIVFSYNKNYSQENDEKDFALWSSVGVDYSPIKSLKFGIEQNLRLKEDASEVDEYFTEIQAEFEIFKNFEIAQAIRIIRENDNEGKKQGYEKHIRFSFDLKYNFDIKRFNLFYRLRYQNKKELDLEEDDTATPVKYLRFKTGFEYKIKNWPLDPEFAVEFFNRKRENYAFIKDAKLSRTRFTLGTSYKIKKFGKFGIYYRYQKNSRIDNDFQTSILGLKYNYSI
jgi:hypothetical protein